MEKKVRGADSDPPPPPPPPPVLIGLKRCLRRFKEVISTLPLLWSLFNWFIKANLVLLTVSFAAEEIKKH